MNFEAMNEQTKKQLMAYLYGELTSEEKQEVEQKLANNPAMQAELEDMQATQELMKNLNDEAVSTSPFFQLMNEKPKDKNQAFRWVGSIAAAILLLLVVGKFTGLKVGSTSEGFEIAFNNPQALDRSEYVAKEDVNQMIQSSLASYDNSLNEQLEKRANQQEALINNQFETNRELLASSVQNIAANNQAMLKNYWDKNSQQQQTYMKSLMGDFTNYVEQRRSEDMQYLMAKINLLETDTDLLELETNQLRTSYATNTNENTY